MTNNTKEYFYEKYRADMEKYLDIDNRELNYQNRIIIPLLEELLKDKNRVDVVDVSTMYKNWNRRVWHDRTKYAGDYTPDILISKNWNIRNKSNEDDRQVEYLCLLELKTPTSCGRVRAKAEVEEYYEKIPCVILTDGITWEFYGDKGATWAEQVICLEEESFKREVCRRGDDKEIHWDLSVNAKGQTKFDELCCKLKEFAVGA